MQKTYNTKAKTAIMECLEDKKDEVFTAAEMFSTLRDSGISMNLATVYRNLEKLAEDGRLVKIRNAESDSVQFRYLGENSHCNEHLHMQCRVCGRIIHLECHFCEEIKEHLLGEHGFELEPSGSVIIGRCSNCRKIRY